MNVFNVLTTGKSRLHEVSISSMFAYLLNSNQDHGLGKKIINSFLHLANQNEIYSNFIDNPNLHFEIDLEVSYKFQNKRNDIDIQIKILDKSYNELHRIIIENKIKASSANKNQPNEYYQAVLNDKENDDAFELEKGNLSVIFLTPSTNKEGNLKIEFDNLKIINKSWLYWTGEKSIVKLIQNILILEHKAEISPINEYIRHTLKAFTHYIIKTIDISKGKNRIGEDIGKLKAQLEILINNKPYTLVLRYGGQIQLLNQDNDKVTARPLLRNFLQEKNIKEKYKNSNTRTIGQQIFDYFDEQKIL